MNELVFMWPHRDLHPNSRVHWSRRAKASKGARALACLLAKGEGWKPSAAPEGRIHVWIDGYPKDRRRRDADGLLSSMKPYLDGIADALGVDDRRFVPHPYIKDEVRGPYGEVRIRITAGP